MKLIDIIRRNPRPAPWSEGEKIPWDDPRFSERMLKEHLSQEHDKASRRAFIIDQHNQWIHKEVLNNKTSRILDLPEYRLKNRFLNCINICTGSGLEFPLHSTRRDRVGRKFGHRFRKYFYK